MQSPNRSTSFNRRLRLSRSLPFAIIFIVLAGTVALALYLKHSVERSGAAATLSRPARPKPPEMAPQPGADPAHIRGPVTARVTLEEFADFECPACGNFYPVLKAVEKEYGAQVSVTFREFPLTMQHQHAYAAARAAEAAGLQGKFWEMHDVLYENRATWSNAADVEQAFEEYARKLGLDLEQFKRDQASERVQNRIALDHRRARSIKVRSTPALYVNGVEIPYSEMKTIESMRTVINKALSSN